MSCTFRAAPDAAKPLYYRVARTSDRRSGATREVKVEQSGVVFFSAECGFSLMAEDASAAVTHQASPPLRLKGQVVEAPPAPKVADGNEKAFTEQIVSQTPMSLQLISLCVSDCGASIQSMPLAKSCSAS